MHKKSFLAGMLSAVMLLTLIGSAYALSEKKTIEVDYSDIQIELHGEKIVPMDASGNIVEPFAYQGTTYLPVRAVGNALGLDVSWDAKNHTVVLENSNDSAINEYNKAVALIIPTSAYMLSHIPNGVIVDALNSNDTLNNSKGYVKQILQDIEELEQLMEEVKSTLIAKGCAEELLSLHTIYFPKLKDLGRDVENALAMLENSDFSGFYSKDEEIMTAGDKLISEFTIDLLNNK